MELKIFWTDFAKSELKKIFNYYKKNVSLIVANKLVSGIVDCTKNISKQPLKGTKEPLLENRIEEFRFLVHKNYKIIY